MKSERISALLKNILVLISVTAACVAVCALLSGLFNDNNPFAVPIFILGVAVISRLSSGYVCGIVAAAIGVFCVNFIFTYPFYQFDLTLSGYPLTFAVMLMVSVIISALTTQMRTQQRLMYEAKSENMRANLLRAISHDIRTPLASIVGASSALLDGDLSESSRLELTEEINKDARWLSRVTENILSVTKFSSEGVKLRLEDEVAEEIVGSAIGKFRKGGGNIAITVIKPEEILLVPMEATLIEQVLINLLENVSDHAPTATRIVITISAADKRAVFCVADNGGGIDRDVLPHLFDGSLVAKDGDTGERNMGIGLSVCRSIVAAHGGGMAAQNSKDGGAAVSFWLPLEVLPK